MFPREIAFVCRIALARLHRDITRLPPAQRDALIAHAATDNDLLRFLRVSSQASPALCEMMCSERLCVSTGAKL